MNIPIVYEDDFIFVINKPSGIAVHKTSTHDLQETVVDILLKQFPSLQGIGEDPLRPGIVHRLDKETSGLMIIAKSNDAFFYFKHLFQERKIQKTYLALVYGEPKNHQGTITAPLGKIGSKQTTKTHGNRDLKERDAITDYKVLKVYNGFSLLSVSPHTGRTHQIRVHLKSIGLPIVGDKLYAPKSLLSSFSASRLFLHAQKLVFTNLDGKSLTLETDLPPELEEILGHLQNGDNALE